MTKVSVLAFPDKVSPIGIVSIPIYKCPVKIPQTIGPISLPGGCYTLLVCFLDIVKSLWIYGHVSWIRESSDAFTAGRFTLCIGSNTSFTSEPLSPGSTVVISERSHSSPLHLFFIAKASWIGWPTGKTGWNTMSKFVGNDALSNAPSRYRGPVEAASWIVMITSISLLSWSLILSQSDFFQNTVTTLLGDTAPAVILLISSPVPPLTPGILQIITAMAPLSSANFAFG